MKVDDPYKSDVGSRGYAIRSIDGKTKPGRDGIIYRRVPHSLLFFYNINQLIDAFAINNDANEK